MALRLSTRRSKSRGGWATEDPPCTRLENNGSKRGRTARQRTKRHRGRTPPRGLRGAQNSIPKSTEEGRIGSSVARDDLVEMARLATENETLCDTDATPKVGKQRGTNLVGALGAGGAPPSHRP